MVLRRYWDSREEVATGAETEAQKWGAVLAWGNHAKTEWGAAVGEKVRGPVLRLGIFSFILLIPAQG